MPTQELKLLHFFLWIRVGVTQKERVTVTLSLIFDASDKLWVKGVGNTGYHNSDREAALTAQAVGQQGGVVIQPGHDLPDTDPSLFRNTRLLVDDCRDGLFRNICRAGDVVHGQFRAARHKLEELQEFRRCRINSAIPAWSRVASSYIIHRFSLREGLPP